MDISDIALAGIPDGIRAESHIAIENDRWLVGAPLTARAMYWWGAFTDWCVAIDHGFFVDYLARGPLIIFIAHHTGSRWALHPTTGEFRNANNRRASWTGFIMRHPDIAAGLLAALPNLSQPCLEHPADNPFNH